MHPDLDPRLAEKLRALPAELRPPLDWAEFAPRLRGRRARRARSDSRIPPARARPFARSWAAAAGACAVLLVAAALVASHHHVLHASGGPALQGAAQRDLAPSLQKAAPDDASAQLLARASAAERWLASRPEGPAVVHVGSRIAVAGLEDDLASLDDELNAARVLDRRGARVRTLELEHARLVDSLAQVRYAEILADETP